MKSTIVRDGMTVALEGSPEEVASAVSYLMGERKMANATATPTGTLQKKPGRPPKALKKNGKKYKRAPWSAQDLLAVTRILIENGTTLKATPRAYQHIKSYGTVRTRSYASVQLIVNDVYKYLRGSEQGISKRIVRDLKAAGYNPGSLPQLGKETVAEAPRRIEVKHETPEPALA